MTRGWRTPSKVPSGRKFAALRLRSEAEAAHLGVVARVTVILLNMSMREFIAMTNKCRNNSYAKHFILIALFSLPLAGCNESEKMSAEKAVQRKFNSHPVEFENVRTIHATNGERVVCGTVRKKGVDKSKTGPAIFAYFPENGNISIDEVSTISSCRTSS